MGKTNSVTRRSIGAIFTILIAATMAMPSLANTVTFKNGSTTPIIGGTYTGTEDTSLFPNDANSNYGADPKIHLGISSDFRTGLIRFDVSALSNQFTQINSITLNLFTDGVFGSDTLQAYQVASANASWIEGVSSGGSANTGEPTWNNRATPSTAWAGTAGAGTAGTDYINTLLASAPYTVSTPLNTALSLSFTGSSAALTTLINTWIDGPNGGLLIRNNGTGYIDFKSRNAAVAFGNPSFQQYHPELVIDFTAVPEPTTALLALSGAFLIWRRRSQ